MEALTIGGDKPRYEVVTKLIGFGTDSVNVFQGTLSLMS
jgi:hypothetical protein